MICVVVCARNEAHRIADCLDAIRATGEASEVIVVDGGSTDGTAAIARDRGALVIVSQHPSLPHDRQLGIDAACGQWIALVDADHRIRPGDLAALVDACVANGWAIAQAGIRTTDVSFWNRAESSFLDLTHNTPGERTMVGVAPAVFHRDLFRLVKFAESGTGGGDDTDLLYRMARDTSLRVGIADVVVTTRHAPRLRDYWRKWRWYGTADGLFMRRYPERRALMLWHLAVRYPIIHPARAVASGHLRAAPYAFLQGLARLSAAL